MAGRIMSMKNSIDTIGNRTHDLSTCSAVPQPAELPRAPVSLYTVTIFYSSSCDGSVIFILLDSYLSPTNTRLQNLLNSLGAREGKIRGF
jgi:hypothetical protein